MASAPLSGGIPATVVVPVKSPTVGLSIVFINGGARDTATVTKVYTGGDPYNTVDLRVSGEPHDRLLVPHETITKVPTNGQAATNLVWSLT